MGLVVEPLSVVSVISILVMISVLVFFYYKKWMMVYGIIFANFIVFFISLFFVNEVIGELAFKPIYLSSEQFPQLYTLFTSMFLHSTYPPFFHIIFNMFMFILIAPSFENRIGASKFLAIYLITGVCAALSHALLAQYLPQDTFPYNPEIGLIGASGAISGILGAYAYAFPRDKVYFPIIIVVRMPVLYAGFIFLSVQSYYIFAGAESNVAYLAHIGGFISGIIISALLIRKKDEWDQPISKRSYDDQKLREIDFSKLRELADTPELMGIVDKIEKETIPQARDMWFDHFMEKVRCPKCKHSLKTSKNIISCENCDFKTEY